MRKTRPIKVQAAKHLTADIIYLQNIYGRKLKWVGLFFTVNLVPCLNMAVHGMWREGLPTAEGHNPTTS